MATLNLRSGVRQRAWPRVVLVRWEETHSKQARFGGGAPGSQGFAWRGLQAGEPVGRLSPRRTCPGPAGPRPFPARAGGGLSVRLSVSPSFPAPTSEFQEEMGRGPPLGPTAGAGEGFPRAKEKVTAGWC